MLPRVWGPLYINSKLSRFVFQVALSLLLAFEKPLISTFQFEKICVKNAMLWPGTVAENITQTRPYVPVCGIHQQEKYSACDPTRALASYVLYAYFYCIYVLVRGTISIRDPYICAVS